MRAKAARADCLRIRLHPEEKALLRLNAAVRGLSIADYIRQTTLGFRARQTALEKERVRQLARIGVNINQLAKWANTYKGKIQAVEILERLVSLETLIREFASVTKQETEPEKDEACT